MDTSYMKNYISMCYAVELFFRKETINKESLKFNVSFYDVMNVKIMRKCFFRGDGDLKDFDLLSCKEKRILILTSEGYTSHEIADMIFVSVNTVNFHIKNTLRKLNAKNKTQAVAIAIILGLI